MLLEAQERAAAGVTMIIPGTIIEQNIHRDMQVLFKKAAVQPWKSPMHTLRKTCLTKWAQEFPIHVVKEWAGHADIETTSQFYLKVGEGDYERAAGLAEARNAAETQVEKAEPPREPPVQSTST